MKLCGIQTDSIVDGLGIRLALFFQGCPHHCRGCHNPESWDYDKVILEKSVSEVLDMFDKDSLLSGITLSGGEPFSERNLEEIAELVKEIHNRGKNVWAYTGYTIEELLEVYPDVKNTILPYIDVLVDGEFIIEERNLMLSFRGSNNQRIIDVQKYLNKEEDFIISM